MMMIPCRSIARRPPCALPSSSRATAPSSSASVSARATFMPKERKRRAAASPMPPAAPVMTGETLASMTAAINIMARALTDRDPRDLAGAHAAMDGKLYGNHAAKAAIEIALHDLVGRASGRPLHALLGRKRRDRMPILGVIGGDNAGWPNGRRPSASLAGGRPF